MLPPAARSAAGAGPPHRSAAAPAPAPAAPALAVRGTVTVEESWAWGADAFDELYGRLDRAGLTPAGPGGALFLAEFFELEEAELTAFVPVNGSVPGSGRVESLTIAAVEAAVMVHSGPAVESNQTYGALGTVVAERAIGVDGPIREYYLVPFTEPDPARHRIRTLDGCGDLGARARGGVRAERLRATPDQPNAFRACHGPGWALVGDAGVVMDSISAQGITNALCDAELLADAIGAGLGGERTLGTALAEHQRRRDAAIEAPSAVPTAAGGA